MRAEFGLKSQMTQSVFKTVIARYKTILENQKEWIKPVSYTHLAVMAAPASSVTAAMACSTISGEKAVWAAVINCWM